MQTWGFDRSGQYPAAESGFLRDRAVWPRPLLMIVCDGMGGAKIRKRCQQPRRRGLHGRGAPHAAPGMTPEKAAAMLRSALELSNSAVFEQSQLSDDFTGMGTTLVAAWISRDLAVVINVGDSRAYHFTREDVRLITRDHSMVAYMVERGELTQEQAKLHPGKNVITRAVGTEPEVEGDIFTCRLRRDECILLCSDGLSNEMADQEMLFEVVHGLSKSDCCQRLLHIAKNRGAPDNVTVTLAAV